MSVRTISVTRWGHGLGIRLPKEFIEKIKLTDKSQVEVTELNGKLIISRVKEARKHIPLADRLKDAEHLNYWKGVPSEPEDIDWGESVGMEEW